MSLFFRFLDKNFRKSADNTVKMNELQNLLSQYPFQGTLSGARLGTRHRDLQSNRPQNAFRGTPACKSRKAKICDWT
jgi:hypothetical protein